MATPVILLPGSSLTWQGFGCASGTERSRMMVNGNRLSTAALPCLSSALARAGWQGDKGRLSVSSTKTKLVDIQVPPGPKTVMFASVEL